MHFEIHSTHQPAAILGEPSSFIDNYLIDVIVFTTDDVPTETLAARMAVDAIDSIRVEQAGQSLFEVCDCDSAGWEAVYSKIFDLSSESPKLREDFYDCENELLWHLVLIYRSVFHPKIRHLQPYIIDHIARTFPNESAILMWEHVCDLKDNELGSLGFRRIAGEGLLLRPNALMPKYQSTSDDKIHPDSDLIHNPISFHPSAPLSVANIVITTISTRS